MKKTFIIAEIGQAHEGSLGILHSYIDALADTKVLMLSSFKHTSLKLKVVSMNLLE